MTFLTYKKCFYFFGSLDQRKKSFVMNRIFFTIEVQTQNLVLPSREKGFHYNYFSEKATIDENGTFL